jgi:glucosyl-dolichyl phosphate glucuronosyltransferase
MVLSVVIPTRNRSERLGLALRSFEMQSLTDRDFEMIVVDNGSTDGTRQVVEEFASRIAHVRYVYDELPGLHVGRHRGFSEANGDILVYVDDDIEAFPTLLKAIWEAFADVETVLVGGKCLPNFEAEPPEWLSGMWGPNAQGDRILSYLSLVDLGEIPKVVNPLLVPGCNFSIRRSVLAEAGGFHPDGMPQELIRFRGDGETYVSNFIFAKGYKALYYPKASVYHQVPAERMTLDYFCRRAFSQGISDSFAAIRESHGLDLRTSPESRKEDSGTIGLIWRKAFRHAVRVIPSKLRFEISSVIRSFRGRVVAGRSRAAEDLARAIAVAYHNGYTYHQHSVQESKELLSWVLRKSYWDGRLPGLIDRQNMNDGG